MAELRATYLLIKGQVWEGMDGKHIAIICAFIRDNVRCSGVGLGSVLGVRVGRLLARSRGGVDEGGMVDWEEAARANCFNCSNSYSFT